MEKTMENRVCEKCGQVITDGMPFVDSDSELLCEDCALDNGYSHCEDCGELVADELIVEVNNGEKYVCRDCIDSNPSFYRVCGECGEVFTIYNGRSNHMHEFICDHCWDWLDYIQCEDCGGFFLRDDAEYVEDDGWYCEDCAPNHYNPLHDYYYKPEPQFIRTGVDAIYPREFFGVELEVDNGDNAGNLCRALGDYSDILYCKHDGSLGSSGVEIVTHPATLNAHMDEGTMPWERIAKVCRSHGYKSHDAKTCGLHIHVSRLAFGKAHNERWDNSRKMNLLVDAMWSEIVLFSRRLQSQLHWTERPSVFFPRDVELSEEELLTAADEDTYDRYRAVNYCNDATIEIRIFRGSLVPETVRASIQLVHNMVKYVCNHTAHECIAATMADVIAEEPTEILTSYWAKRSKRVEEDE